MFWRDAFLYAPQVLMTQNSSRRTGAGHKSYAQSHRSKRSDFLRAYSPLNISQALRVISVVLIVLGFTRFSHVAQDGPGPLVSGLSGHGFISDLRYRR